MNRRVTFFLLVLLGLAAILRMPMLDLRPMHNDEGVNAYKFAQLWEKGDYRYDPNEHHGPTLYYASYAWIWLTGSPKASELSDARLRVVTVLFGLGMLCVLPLFVDALGRRGIVYAGLFTAISPAMVFYSRYYIHEMLLVFFTALAMGAAWRYWRSRRAGWAILAGLAIGLMDATKETFVIALAAAVIALLVNQTWNRWADASGIAIRAPKISYQHLGFSFAAWLVIAFILFSSFFANPSGPLDSIRSYLPWLNRAGGESPHIHPWYFYFHRLLWFQMPKGPVFTELMIFVLAIIGAWSGFARKHLGRASASFVRFLALYTVALAVAYSIISYKTPWCLLGFWHGAVLLAGVGLAFLMRSLKRRWLRVGLATLIGVGILHLGWQSWAMNTRYAEDPRNPHVYAHTSADLLRLVKTVDRIASTAPADYPVVVKVIAPGDDFWPLPWYLRNLTNGWYAQLPHDPFAPIMIVSSKFVARLDEQGTHLMTGYYQLRPGEFFELYVELNLWKAYLQKNPPDERD